MQNDKKYELDEYFHDAKHFGSLRESAIVHGLTTTDEAGVADILKSNSAYGSDIFPYQELYYSSWVRSLLGNIRVSPFPSIRTRYTEYTNGSVSCGYKTGAKKSDRVRKVGGRVTDPQMVVNMQQLDHDDVLDAYNMDMTKYLYQQAGYEHDRIVAQAILIGDRVHAADSSEYVSPEHIRPIVGDEYTKVVKVGSEPDILLAARPLFRKAYTRSNATAYIPSSKLEMLFGKKEADGTRMYADTSQMAWFLGVTHIVEVDIDKEFGGAFQVNGSDILAICFNEHDYVLSSKGENFFTDFDISANKNLSLLERQLAGSLICPGAAVVVTM